MRINSILPLRSDTTARTLATSGLTANNLPAASGVRGGHLYRDCPEKRKASSTMTCCNCLLAEGEAAHPANYCGYAKEEMQKKSQGTPKNTTGRVFWSKLIKPNAYFIATLRGYTSQKMHQEAAANTWDPETPKKLHNRKQVSHFRLPM
jgi:hypothetical protein